MPFTAIAYPAEIASILLKVLQNFSAKRTTFPWSHFCPNYKPKRRAVTYSIPLLATRFHKC